MSAPPKSLLELARASVVRNGRRILDVDHFARGTGEHLALLGPNGSGDSTFVGLLTRDVLPLAPQDPGSGPQCA